MPCKEEKSFITVSLRDGSGNFSRNSCSYFCNVSLPNNFNLKFHSVLETLIIVFPKEKSVSQNEEAEVP